MKYRHKAMLPVLGMILLLIVVVLCLGSVAAGNGSSATRRATEIARPDAFVGGIFEASGVVYVPGTAGVIFIDDGRPTEVFWMKVDANGKQAGAITPIRLGASIIDMEGITTDGTYIYVVGSTSKPKGGDQAGLARFKFDAGRGVVEQLQTVSGLKGMLTGKVDELKGMRDLTYERGGLNIEGLAWDFTGKRLLLGLRSPVVGGQALVVPVSIRDSAGTFAASNLEVESRALRLALGGAGIRSIEFDEKAAAYKVISGGSGAKDQLDFKLWNWDGAASSAKALQTFERGGKPEGVTRFLSGNANFPFIVFDNSAYLRMSDEKSGK